MKSLASDRISRPVVLVLIAILLLITWGLPGVGKLLSGGVPGWFSEQFGKTFLNTFPGLFVSYYSIAVLEALAALAALGSLLRGEFLRQSHPPLLNVALLLSLVLFAQLSFGKQILGDFGGTHDLFMYFAGTLVMLAAVRAFRASRVNDSAATAA